MTWLISIAGTSEQILLSDDIAASVYEYMCKEAGPGQPVSVKAVRYKDVCPDFLPPTREAWILLDYWDNPMLAEGEIEVLMTDGTAVLVPMRDKEAEMERISLPVVGWGAGMEILIPRDVYGLVMQYLEDSHGDGLELKAIHAEELEERGSCSCLWGVAWILVNQRNEPELKRGMFQVFAEGLQHFVPQPISDHPELLADAAAKIDWSSAPKGDGQKSELDWAEDLQRKEPTLLFDIQHEDEV